MKETALFILKLKEIQRISQANLDIMIADFMSMTHLMIDQLKVDVDDILKQHGLSISSLEGLEGAFLSFEQNYPFKNLSSKYLQEKYFKEHLSFIVS